MDINTYASIKSQIILCSELMKESIFLSHSQICANLDSVIVSTKKFAPVLRKVVPKPKKQYDIVEKRALVFHNNKS